MVKSKVRFDGLDCAAMVAHWNRVALGRRVINIYNGPNGDTYLFKMDKLFPGEKSHMLLVLESGIRFHTTQQPYENPGMPSPFCSKLRKHLRGLRLENVQQLGNKDRVIHLVFGSGEQQRHSLIMELYARGNLVLTNANYTILSLLRSHEYNEKDGTDADNKVSVIKVKVGNAYPVTFATTVSAPGASIEESNQTTTQGDSSNNSPLLIDATNPLEWFHQNGSSSPTGDEEDSTVSGGKKTKKKKGGDNNNIWRSLLLKPESGVSHYGPALIDHCLLCADIDRQTPLDSLDKDGWLYLQGVLRREGGRILASLEGAETKGYILYQPKSKPDSGTLTEQGPDDNAGLAVKQLPPSPFEDKLLLEFQPHLLRQHETLLKIEYDSLDAAVDAFFSHIEGQKRLLRADAHQSQAQQRLEKIRLDQQHRVEALMQQQDILMKQALLVELHAGMVEKAIQVVNSALDSGMDWDQLEDLVEVEKYQNQNPVAMLIHKLELDSDAIVVRIDTHEEDSPMMDITVSLKETAHGNASSLFAEYRAAKEKSAKTIEASAKALQAAEETAQRQFAEAMKRKSNVSSTLQTKRKTLWFEKFNWFITSDNYLVIAGRDAQQNEQVVKRYLRPGDAYLHADVHGAASCVLRAKRRRTANGRTEVLPLSDQALREAGNFTICRSSAWSSRMVTSAWWVQAHQVSKTAPTGEYLTVGSFMIRGKKNFLPPSQLEMGLGVLFRLGDDESIARHKNERRDFALMQLDDESEAGDRPGHQQMKRINDLATTKMKEEKKSKGAQIGEASNELVAELVADDPPKSIDDLNSDPPNYENDGKSAPLIPDQAGRDAAVKNGAAEDVDPLGASSKAKKGLSARDQAAQEAEEARKLAEEEREGKLGSKYNQQTPQTSTKRGQRGKMKRAAKKYSQQDDEDRELALLALHAGEKEKKWSKSKNSEMNETEMATAAETIAILKKDSTAIAEQLPGSVRSALEKCVTVQIVGSEEMDVRWEKFDGDVLEQLLSLELHDEQVAAAERLLHLKESTRIDNFSASLAGIIRTIRKYGHKGLELDATPDGDDTKRKTKVEKEAENESWKKTLAEEGLLDEDVEEFSVDDTLELAKLTGKPMNEDLILFAVPVCAPYQTLAKYAHRVKLTPGNMKRGKAAKGCVDLFLKDGNSSPLALRSIDLIKKVSDNEWVQVICGDVKISAAGASKAIQKQKNKNKSKKRK